MVFRSISETHTATRTTQSHTDSNTTNTANTHIVMASSTVKPHQPLHNFPLQDLKWSMNQTTTTHHRFRSSKSPHREAAADSDAEARIDKKPDAAAADSSDKKSKIFIRLRANKSGSSSSKCVTHDEDEDVGAGSGSGSADDAPGVDHHESTAAAAVVALAAEDAEESVPKTWNLRPRRAVTNINNNKVGASNGTNGGALKIGGAAAPEIRTLPPSSSNRSELTRSNRNGNDANANGNDYNNKKKEKEKEKRMMSLSVPLTKEEIEEDIYSLTGSKPARRPKKRAKHVQKQLDCLFPGLWLVSITPDCYKVPEAPSKLRM